MFFWDFIIGYKTMIKNLYISWVQKKRNCSSLPRILFVILISHIHFFKWNVLSVVLYFRLSFSQRCYIETQFMCGSEGEGGMCYQGLSLTDGLYSVSHKHHLIPIQLILLRKELASLTTIKQCLVNLLWSSVLRCYYLEPSLSFYF